MKSYQIVRLKEAELKGGRFDATHDNVVEVINTGKERAEFWAKHEASIHTGTWFGVVDATDDRLLVAYLANSEDRITTARPEFVDAEVIEPLLDALDSSVLRGFTGMGTRMQAVKASEKVLPHLHRTRQRAFVALIPVPRLVGTQDAVAGRVRAIAESESKRLLGMIADRYSDYPTFVRVQIVEVANKPGREFNPPDTILVWLNVADDFGTEAAKALDAWHADFLRRHCTPEVN